MKFNFRTSFYVMLAAIPFIMVSCSKTGPTGPAGATGPAGPTGAAGAAGTQGAQGNPGTANVIYSPWLDVTYSPAATDSSAWRAEIPAPQLVDSILNKGTMKVYLNIGSDSIESQLIVALPIADVLLTGYIVNSYFANSLITLIANGDAGTFTNSSGNKQWQYRYVLIPGGTAAGRRPNGIDWNNYAEVKKYLGLKD